MRFTHRFAAALALLLVPFAAGCRGGLGSPRTTAGESAIAQLRTINTAEAAYLASHDHYACTMAELGSQFGLIDRDLSYGQKDGYYFNLKCPPAKGVPTYQAWASPVETGLGGHSFYCTDQTGAIRRASGRIEDCGDASPVN
jgi:hypothetical protein